MLRFVVSWSSTGWPRGADVWVASPRHGLHVLATTPGPRQAPRRVSLTEAQVIALAPDASSVDAAKRHARPAAWRNLGHDARAIWGEVMGRGPYQVRADLMDLGTKCSCPSRKLPCKHALGLLMVAAHHPAQIPEASAPEWVREWLARRDVRLARSAERAAGNVEPDLEAKKKRAATRERRVELGIEGLERWLEDVARTGLASLAADAALDGGTACEAQAARLTDAQANGLASRVRRVGETIGQGPDWPERAAHDLGRLALLARAWKRREALSPELAAELAQLVGFTVTEATVRESGPRASDAWVVVGQRVEEDERLKSARTWLWGARSGRTALVLQFALPTATFTERFVGGSWFEGELCWYPAAVPRRALVTARHGVAQPLTTRWTGHPTVTALLDAHAARMAEQPWIDRTLALLEAVVPVIDPATGVLHARDVDGLALPLELREPWPLLALSGGRPLALAAEWDSERLHPLGVWADGAYHHLGEGDG